MSPTIERYNQQMGSWELVTSFPRNRRLFAVTSVKNKIYVFGGRDGNDYTALPDWDAFDVNKNTWESVSYSKPTMQRRLPKLCFYGGQTVTLPSPFMQWSACDEGNR
jgi:N-acetylneuraminic acid mutarotase